MGSINTQLPVMERKKLKIQFIKENTEPQRLYFFAPHHKLSLSGKRARKASFRDPVFLPQSCGDTAILTPFHHCSARKQPVWQKQMDSAGRNSNGPQTQPRHWANSAVNKRGSGDRGSCWTWITFVSANPKQPSSFCLQITSETVFKNTIFKPWGTKCGIKRISIYQYLKQTSFCHVIIWSHRGVFPFNTQYSHLHRKFLLQSIAFQLLPELNFNSVQSPWHCLLARL